jgi:hypothetical protein
VSICAVQAVFSHSQAEESIRMVMVYIAWRAHKETDCCSVGLEEVATACKISTRHVRNAVRWLADHGEIEIVSTGQGRGRLPVWRVTLPLEKPEPQFRYSGTENRNPSSVKQEPQFQETGTPVPVLEGTPLNKDIEGKTKRPRNARAPARTSFERFWEPYPKKTDKQRAAALWQAMSEENRVAAIAGLDKWFTSHQWREPQFVTNPSKYLRERKWEEEPLQAHQQGATNPNGRKKSLSVEEAMTIARASQERHDAARRGRSRPDDDRQALLAPGEPRP